MDADKNFLVGVFDDEDAVLNGIRKVRGAGLKIHDVFSPFPVHGIDDALGIKKSRLPIAAFLFGLTGTSLALTMQIWMLGYDWPMIIGGKDPISIPNYIPITFEGRVLFTAFGMVITFFISNGLGPGTHFHPRFDVRATDNKFVMAIEMSRNSMSEEEISRALKDSGAEEVNIKQF